MRCCLRSLCGLFFISSINLCFTSWQGFIRITTGFANVAFVDNYTPYFNCWPLLLIIIASVEESHELLDTLWLSVINVILLLVLLDSFNFHFSEFDLGKLIFLFLLVGYNNIKILFAEFAVSELLKDTIYAFNFGNFLLLLVYYSLFIVTLL